MTSPLRLGAEEFWLDSTDAAEVQRLYATDRQAGLSLAWRRAQRASMTVSMLMIDGVAPALSQPLRDAAPSPPPAQPPRTTPMTPMTKIKVGDRDHYVDPAVARELESLRGANAVYVAIVQGGLQPPAAHPVVDAVTDSRIAYRDALRADEARRNDPSTPSGQYRQYLQNAHKQGR